MALRWSCCRVPPASRLSTSVRSSGAAHPIWVGLGRQQVVDDEPEGRAEGLEGGWWSWWVAGPARAARRTRSPRIRAGLGIARHGARRHEHRSARPSTGRGDGCGVVWSVASASGAREVRGEARRGVEFGSTLSLRRERDDEAGSPDAVAAILHATDPPWSRTCSATRARPRPVPLSAPRDPAVAPRENRSKIRSRSSGATPSPASSTANSHLVAAAAQADGGGATGVLGRVVEQVGHHSGHAPLVELDHDLGQADPRR
jgi:hypothetical protein